MPNILLIQGANLTYLGKREPHIYGTTTAAELDARLHAHAGEHDYELDIFYTNIEGGDRSNLRRGRVRRGWSGDESCWLLLRRTCPARLSEGCRATLCRSTYQQYRNPRHSLRVIRCCGRHDYRLWVTWLRDGPGGDAVSTRRRSGLGTDGPSL